MAIRCLLFTADETTAEPIRRVLMELGVEGEYCPTAVEAVERVTSQALQIVIFDWDNPEEAAVLLKTARERKAAERPLTLAIVSDDTGAQQVLQAGANSILRKPVQLEQAKGTLTKARDLLRAQMESAAPMARAAAASSSSSTPAPPAFTVAPPLPDQGGETTLHAGEFLSGVSTPGVQFDTESDLHKAMQQPSEAEMDSVEELEPMAAAMATPAAPVEPAEPSYGEPRGLEWYKARAAKMAAAPQARPEPTQNKTELLGYEQSTSPGTSYKDQDKDPAQPNSNDASTSHRIEPAGPTEKEQKDEAALFAHISGETPKETRSRGAQPRPWLNKVIFSVVLVLVAAIAYLEVPQQVWVKNFHFLATYVKQAGHSWLNPQPVAPPQAPTSHESFNRAGDEYKLPAAEAIPDASTDPSQIRVAPVVDPTAKQPNTGINPEALTSQNSVQPGGQTATDPNQAQGPATPASVTPSSVAPPPSTPGAATPITGEQPAPPQATPLPPAANNPPPQAVPLRAADPQPTTSATNSKIPTSLKSTMAVMTPDASGNKAAESALPSIEPVEVSEATARGLVLQQADPVYPATAKGQQGTVVLQVLIGRDGTVQDAKFLQGSLAFARTAIETVQQWRFKPYSMNGRPVSTKTVITLAFRPPA